MRPSVACRSLMNYGLDLTSLFCCQTPPHNDVQSSTPHDAHLPLLNARAAILCQRVMGWFWPMRLVEWLESNQLQYIIHSCTLELGVTEYFCRKRAEHVSCESTCKMQVLEPDLNDVIKMWSLPPSSFTFFFYRLITKTTVPAWISVQFVSSPTTNGIFCFMRFFFSILKTPHV